MNSEMDSNILKHSNEGISISSRFYNKRVMVYVEGPDDIPFWDAMFQRVVDDSFYEIEAVNGKNQLSDYISKIENGSISNAFVATDLDYCLYPSDGRSQSAYVIYTYGHSIENTMFCPQNIAAFIKRATRSTKSFCPQVEQWYQSICDRVLALLPYEILNSTDVDCCFHVSDGNNSILGKRFYFFQDKTDELSLDPSVIDTETNSHQDFDKNEISRINDFLTTRSPRETRHLIQGHFLADAAMNFIRVSLRKMGQKGFSDNSIYLSFFDCYAKCPSLCHDKMHVCNYIKRAVDTYNSRQI